METNQLKAFCVIVETGNLRKAADLLGISHSGLSKSMKVFQAEMNQTLFQGSGRGIVITDEGQALYRRSKIFFSELARLMNQDGTIVKSVLRIGSFEVFTSHLMGELVKDYLPETELEIHELVPGRLEEALASNRIDIGITYEPVPRKGIDFAKITSVHMGAYARTGAFKNKNLDEIPFAVPVNPLEGTPSGVKGLDAWPEQKHERLIRYRVDLMATGLALARQGLCAIFIPDFVARLHNAETTEPFRLQPLEIPRTASRVRRDVYLVKRESMIEDQMTKRIAKAIRLLCVNNDS